MPTPNTSATGGPLAPIPQTPAPLEGRALWEFLQPWLAGITGIAGTLFFPRWQPEPPNYPAYGTDWAAFGITLRKNDTFAYVGHAGGSAAPAGWAATSPYEPGTGILDSNNNFQICTVAGESGGTAPAWATVLGAVTRDNIVRWQMAGPWNFNGQDTVVRQQVLEMLVSFYGPNADSFAELLVDGLSVAQNWEYLYPQDMALVATGDPATVPELVKERWLYRVDVPVTLRRSLNRTYPVED